MSVDVEELLPRQRVRWHRAAGDLGRDGEPRRREHRPSARALRRVRSSRDVLRARLGGRAASGSGCAALRQRGHEVASHGYAHRLIYDQTPSAFRAGRAPRQASSSRTRRDDGWSATARPATRSRRGRCGRSTFWSRRATSTTRASSRSGMIATAFRCPRGEPYRIERHGRFDSSRCRLRRLASAR